jgi:hypothetical protein
MAGRWKKVDVPAYQIGGVFLLMALFMYGTSVSGFFPKLSGHGKTVALVIALVALVVLGMRYWPQMVEQARTAWIGAPEAKPVAATPAAVTAAKPKASRAPKTAVVSQPKIVIPLDDSPQIERVIVEPAPADGPTGTNPYDSKLKHAAKSVGRFLHVVPRKDP